MVKRIQWSYLSCRIRLVVPIWQPYIRWVFQAAVSELLIPGMRRDEETWS
jgi:hypothetical protein